jgi:hypothetical protein
MIRKKTVEKESIVTLKFDPDNHIIKVQIAYQTVQEKHYHSTVESIYHRTEMEIEQRYVIDPGKIISPDCPIGAAIMHKSVGDRFKASTGQTGTILSIE